MRTALPILVNVVIASGLYFAFIVFFGAREAGEAAWDALTFAAIYGAIQVAVHFYKRGKQ